MNILLTSSGSGRRARLVKAFVDSLKSFDPSGNVVVIDADPFTPCMYINEKSYIVPKVASPGFDETLLKICRRENIDWIIPTTDSDILHFARNRQQYKNDGVNTLVSSPNSVMICNDKTKFSEYFSRTDIRIPRSYTRSDGPPAGTDYPLIIKPSAGAGSKDTFIVRNEKELDFFCEYLEGKGPIVQEYVEGREFTIDVLLDLDGKPVSVVPRERKYTRSGVSDVGITTRDQSLIDFGLLVANSLEFIGPINIQCIRREDGELVLIEVNPRFSGGISLTLESGAAFPDWVLKMCSGQGVASRIGEFEPSLAMMVYEDACYLPIDIILKKGRYEQG